ncbi:MAG: AMP-binding protein [Actinomycetota bacterium]|nr:AMP-binding protein [Actinomycetota bacterium]
MTTTPGVQRVHELLEQYDHDDACAAELLCDRHPPDAVAFTIVEPDLSTRDLTYGELTQQSRAFAAALHQLGVGPGDGVAVLMGKSAELPVALLGIWRLGAVHIPLFTAFAPPAIALRLNASDAKVVIVDADQRHKLEPGEDMPADRAWRTVVVGAAAPAGELSFDDLVEGCAEAPFDAHVGGGHGKLVHLFTSGTTGTPKAVPVPIRALASFHAYIEFGLDVSEADVFWNAADPGWAYGLYYAVLGPMAAGRRSVLLHGGFSAPLTYEVMTGLGVTNFAAAPTVYRALRADATGGPPGLRLRRASSAGEPLTPDVISWSEAALGVTVRDHYGQTEHGMVIVNAWHDSLAQPVRPGSMGLALPGWSAAVLDDGGDRPAPAGLPGRVAIDIAESPLIWFDGYVDAPDRTAERFSRDGRWYITGDAGRADDDGFFYFSSRDDDVIIMAGYRIGPFDVESVLVLHPSVVEAAVVGRPDALRGESLEAFVVLRDSWTGSAELTQELQKLVKDKFAAHAYPRAVHYVDALPKTPSGKVQRYLLRK